MKKSVTSILILAILFALAQPAFAAVPPSVDPQYTNAQSVSVSLNISSSGTATSLVRLTGKTGLTNASVTTYLEKKVGGLWVPVDDWQYSTSVRVFSKTYSEQLSGSGEYRAVAKFTLKAATVENITVTSYDSY